MRFILSAISIIVFSCFFFTASAQVGTTFWFAVPEVSQNGGANLDRPIFLRMTAFAAPATVTVSQPAGGGMPPQVLAIPAGGTMSLNLTPWIGVLENTPANTVLNYGIMIQSTSPISAYYDVVSGACLCNPEDFILKGDNSLGTDFWIPGQTMIDNTLSYTPIPTNAFDIIATQNGTVVTITPSQNIIGHIAGVPFTVTLNMGQTYSATAASNIGANHLVGSRVTSNKPIAITEKDDLLDFFSPATSVRGQDLIGDQIVPTNILGTEYIPMYGNLSPPDDQLFITATQNGTVIDVNGSTVATINAGQTYQMSAIVPSCYIKTTFPVYVYQLSGIASEVGSALLPQINCTGSATVSFNQSSTINFKLNLLVKSTGINNFLVNGVPGVITGASFTPVTGTSGIWYSAQVTLNVASYPIGSVLTVSNTSDLFQLGFLSSGPVGSGASFGYFSNYGGISPHPVVSPALCVGDSVQFSADSITGAIYRWSGPGGFTSTQRSPFIGGSTLADTGSYKIVVEENACKDSGTVHVDIYPYPVVKLGNDTLVCNGQPITIGPVKTLAPGLTYVWSTGLLTPTITVTSSGTYSLKVFDHTCPGSDTIKVRMEPPPNAGFTIANSCDTSVVSFSNLYTGGGYYTWNFGDGTSLDTGRYAVAHTFKAQQVYTVVFTQYTEACSNDTTFVIDTRHIVHADFTGNDTICLGAATVLTDASTPASAVAAHNWTFGDGGSNTISGPVTWTYTAPGIYPITLTITDTLGCVDSVTKGVTVLQLQSSGQLDTTLCVSQPFAIGKEIAVKPFIYLGASPFIYSWSPSANLSDTSLQQPYYKSGLGVTTYTITATLKHFGCIVSDTLRINSVPGMRLANVTNNTTISYGSSVFLNADSEVYYRWTPDDGSLSNANISNPVARPLVSTAYTVYGYDRNGCIDSTYVTISIDSSMAECVPSAFTPNGDGLNDIFRPACIKFQSLVDFRIYNRWGREVFYSNSFKHGWDGTFNGEPQDMDVYFYAIVVAKPGTHENVVYKGDVTLIR